MGISKGVNEKYLRPKTNNNLNITKQWLIRRMENQRLIKLPPGNRKMMPTMFLQQFKFKLKFNSNLI